MSDRIREGRGVELRSLDTRHTTCAPGRHGKHGKHGRRVPSTPAGQHRRLHAWQGRALRFQSRVLYSNHIQLFSHIGGGESNTPLAVLAVLVILCAWASLSRQESERAGVLAVRISPLEVPSKQVARPFPAAASSRPGRPGGGFSAGEHPYQHEWTGGGVASGEVERRMGGIDGGGQGAGRAAPQSNFRGSSLDVVGLAWGALAAIRFRVLGLWCGRGRCLRRGASRGPFRAGKALRPARPGRLRGERASSPESCRCRPKPG